MASKIGILRVQVQSMLETLRKTPPGKSDKVTTHLAERFNNLLAAVKAAIPDTADSLPSPIKSAGHFAIMGYSDANHVDLLVYLEELNSILAFVDE